MASEMLSLIGLPSWRAYLGDTNPLQGHPSNPDDSNSYCQNTPCFLQQHPFVEGLNTYNMRIFHTLVPSKVGEMNQPSHWHVHRVKKMGSITASSFWRSFTESGEIFEGNAQIHWKYIVHCMGQYIEPQTCETSLIWKSLIRPNSFSSHHLQVCDYSTPLTWAITW